MKLLYIINYLRNEFNGTEGYLKFIGFNEKDIEILKLSFLEKENWNLFDFWKEK